MLAFQVAEDPTDDISAFDARNDPHDTATLLTHLDINAEYPPEKASLASSTVLLGRGQRVIRSAPLATP